LRAYLALASVCFFWGTTYIAIRMSLESFPPLMLVSARFILSGALMLGTALAQGRGLPRGRELAIACMSGIMVLGGGNGCLVYAETIIASGLAGLFITLSPFWLVGIEALLPGGERLHLPTVGGMLIGFAGVGVLVAPDLKSGAGGFLLTGFLILQLGNALWCGGSVFQRRQPTRVHPVLIGAVQQLAAGLAFLPPALLVHEHPVHWSARGVAALLYLVLFGSIVGYSAYVYAMDKLPVAVVSIYPYVNAVVAVTLGWVFYREPFGTREAAAMAIIFAGVAVVKYTTRGQRIARPAATPASEAKVA
jgi:drug/metabolite transporter (DMT)-like permease